MITLSELITKTKEELERLQYSKSTIKNIQIVWKQLKIL